MDLAHLVEKCDFCRSERKILTCKCVLYLLDFSHIQHYKQFDLHTSCSKKVCTSTGSYNLKKNGQNLNLCLMVVFPMVRTTGGGFSLNNGRSPFNVFLNKYDPIFLLPPCNLEMFFSFNVWSLLIHKTLLVTTQSFFLQHPITSWVNTI